MPHNDRQAHHRGQRDGGKQRAAQAIILLLFKAREHHRRDHAMQVDIQKGGQLVNQHGCLRDGHGVSPKSQGDRCAACVDKQRHAIKGARQERKQQIKLHLHPDGPQCPV